MGQPKGLLPHPVTHLPLARHVTNVLRDGGASPLAIVTGAQHDLLCAAIDDASVSCLHNARHDDGQLASLQCAIAWGRAVPEAAWLLVTLVDLPGIRPDTVALLIDVARRSTAGAVRPRLDGRHGHPVLWHASAWDRLDAADPQTGARAVMHALAAAGDVEDVPVDDPGVLRDLDTPDDYARFVLDHGGASERAG